MQILRLYICSAAADNAFILVGKILADPDLKICQAIVLDLTAEVFRLSAPAQKQKCLPMPCNDMDIRLLSSMDADMKNIGDSTEETFQNISGMNRELSGCRIDGNR